MIIVPTSIFDVMEEADDFYFPPLVGNYIRFSRFIMSVLSLILTPMWMALIEYPERLPDWLAFINLAMRRIYMYSGSLLYLNLQ